MTIFPAIFSLCMIDFSDRSFKEIKKFDNLNQLYIFPNIYLNDNLLYYQYAYYDDLSINENEHDSDVQENSYIFFESVNIDSGKVRKILNFLMRISMHGTVRIIMRFIILITKRKKTFKGLFNESIV